MESIPFQLILKNCNGKFNIFLLNQFIRFFFSLEILNLQSNRLSSLPIEIEHLKRLRDFYLSFNLFKDIPISLARLTNIRCSDVSHLALAGNHIRKLSIDAVQ
jgi:Leucine-rich repeat (LRR) protein